MDYHCHLVGYPAKRTCPSIPAPTASLTHQLPLRGLPRVEVFDGVRQTMVSHQLPLQGSSNNIKPITDFPASITSNISDAAHSIGAFQDPAEHPHLSSCKQPVIALSSPTCSQRPAFTSPHLSASKQVVTALSAPAFSTHRQSFTDPCATAQTEVCKRRTHENVVKELGSLKTPAVDVETADGPGSSLNNQLDRSGRKKRMQDLIVMCQNKKLRSQCTEMEKVEKLLLLKEQELRKNIQECLQIYNSLLVELNPTNEIKLEKL